MATYQTSYPKDNNFQDSVFFLWIEFLKRNKSYKSQCIAGEGGKIYDAFGDIFETSFIDWWDRHDDLFMPDTSLAVNFVENTKDLKQALSDGWEVFALDPKCNKETILFWLNDLFFKNQPDIKNNQDHNVIKKPLYEPIGRVNIPALKKILEIFDLHEANSKKPHHKIFDLAVEKGIIKIKNEDGIYGGDDDSEIRNAKTSSISRWLEKAGQIIENVELGKFPVYNVKKSKANQ